MFPLCFCMVYDVWCLPFLPLVSKMLSLLTKQLFPNRGQPTCVRCGSGLSVNQKNRLSAIVGGYFQNNIVLKTNSNPLTLHTKGTVVGQNEIYKLQLGRSGRAIFGTQIFGSQTPPCFLSSDISLTSPHGPSPPTTPPPPLPHKHTSTKPHPTFDRHNPLANRHPLVGLTLSPPLAGSMDSGTEARSPAPPVHWAQPRHSPQQQARRPR